MVWTDDIHAHACMYTSEHHSMKHHCCCTTMLLQLTPCESQRLSIRSISPDASECHKDHDGCSTNFWRFSAKSSTVWHLSNCSQIHRAHKDYLNIHWPFFYFNFNIYKLWPCLIWKPAISPGYLIENVGKQSSSTEICTLRFKGCVVQ